MYQPPHFREDRIEVQHDLIRTHPLGLLVTSGPSGLMANPIPWLVDANASDLGTLCGHLARANPQLRELSVVDECMLVFQGPQQYITPSWYETKRETGMVVPTWNYATVHVWGRPRIIDDVDWLRSQIEALTRSHEDKRSASWHVADAPETFIAAQVRVSQNRPEADRAGVLRGLIEEGEASASMAQLVAQRSKLRD